ncbi:hypothetical protein HYPSUDRAFT_49986 [Hypholoma sublateritium FD-334 SS-4]|uniref:Autophagy-related protein 18 n=1 Tax=Hypholoma sublateritium (strain FD-334 SS-4) TaxID=945553 RepID=A0A0D2LQZ6_HYPSF|nr:hypothetical protein HYPSUDRAFT_49986 [Hypholoma sublateritium FD-334 SS-4]
MVEKANSNMLFANFNQDFSCISVGTPKGYSVTNCDPFGRVYTMNDGARGIVEMLFCTSLIVLLNRKSLVIVLEMEIYIYDISNMRLLHVIETTPNPDAICSLSPPVDSSYLAYPSPVPSLSAPLATPSAPTSAGTAPAPTPSSSAAQSGDVLLFSTRSLTVANVIQVHKAPLAFLALNAAGTLLATASDKGTVIQKLYQLRRGTRETRIYSMNFNVVGSLLAVSSAHDTVYVFKLGGAGGGSGKSGGGSGGAEAPRSPPDSVDGASADSVGGYEAFVAKQTAPSVSSSLRRKSLQMTKSLSHSVGGYLPHTLTELWEPARAFASLRLPTSGARTVVALSGTMPHVMVLSSEGYFYLYSIDLEKGGECALMKQYNLLDSGDEGTGMADWGGVLG